MKKIIFGGASAALALIGFSAFKTANKTATTYYWFEIKSGEAPKVSSGPVGTISASNVTFALKATTVPSSNNICDKTNTYFCLIGFTAGQVVASGTSFTLANPITTPVTAPSGASHLQYVRSLK